MVQNIAYSYKFVKCIRTNLQLKFTIPPEVRTYCTVPPTMLHFLYIYIFIYIYLFIYKHLYIYIYISCRPTPLDASM